ncbi:MAG: molybdopterin-dependent oxidoreductase [Candidatus Rokubacteria bacterium]|nr:molybdopterin-dependent oxidoreductase [Candidatus Rokubacteria bacterium]
MTPAALTDRWIPSTCSLCYGTCSILGHERDGVLVKIEGNPASAIGRGRLCGKGVSGIMTLYDPNRVNVPLRRTNPVKGKGVDPAWKEITWDAALDEITARLEQVHDDDPRKLFIQRTTTNTSTRAPMMLFAAAFGTPNSWAAGGGLHCGNGAHLIGGLYHASWSLVPDFQHCRYAIYFGASKGHGAGHVSCTNMQQAADARARGMKLTVVDPMCNFASAKATEWVPIRPGTDAAMGLAMLHVILVELGVWDAEYLAAKTNAPYLIGPDRTYVRDPESGKPLVWDTVRDRPVPYDTPDAGTLALEGERDVNGARARPAFALLREHVQGFTPEWAETISTVPAATIRRIAREFASEAMIGSTIVLDGRRLPYRPVAAIYFRGAQGHKNSVHNCFVLELLNQVVGAADVPGGALGFNPVCYGHPETGKPWYEPKPGPDGLMVTGTWVAPHLPYPIAEPRLPDQMSLGGLFPLGMFGTTMASSDQEELWSRFDLPYRPEVMLNYGANSLLSVGNSDTVAETLAKIPFIVSIDITLTEFSEFADIVLPDTSYLESLDSRPNVPFIFNHPAGLGEWSWPIKQPVVSPEGARRQAADVLIELVDRLGIRAAFNAAANTHLELDGEHRLEFGSRYSYADICDRELKSHFGAARGLEWFKEHGVISWPKRVEEVYWRPFLPVRVPIYWEFLVGLNRKAKAIANPRGLDWDDAWYEPLPRWLPCPSHEVTDASYDLWGFYYRDTLHTNSFTNENPWLDEASRLDPYSYTIALNAATGRRKGLADGQHVWLESTHGRRVRGRVRLTETVHPETVGIGGCAGHWARTLPIAAGKGVMFNDLLEIDWHHGSPVNLNIDTCVRLRIVP